MALTAYQAHMKRELKGKMKGKTAAQRKAIFKAAAKSYKSPSKKASKTNAGRSKPAKKTGSKPKSNTSSGGNRSMGKGSFNTQKIFKYIRLASLGAPAIAGVAQYGFTKEAAVEAIKGYTGVNLNTGGFDMQAVIRGYTPFLATTVLTYGIPKLAGILRGL